MVIKIKKMGNVLSIEQNRKIDQKGVSMTFLRQGGLIIGYSRVKVDFASIEGISVLVQSYSSSSMVPFSLSVGVTNPVNELQARQILSIGFNLNLGPASVQSYAFLRWSP